MASLETFREGDGLVRDAALLTGSQYVAAAAGLATTLIAARWLGPSDFGVAAVIMAYPAAVTAFLSVKSGTITLRYLPAMRQSGRTEELLALCKLGFGVDLAATGVGCLLIVVAALAVGDLPGTDGRSDLVAVYAASLPIASFAGTGLAVMSTFGRFGVASWLQIADKLLVLVAVVIALLVAVTPASMIIGTAIGQVAAGLLWLVGASAILIANGGRWWQAPLRRVAYLTKELRSLFGWGFLSVTFSGVVSQLPVILLGSIRSSSEAAFFRLASTLAVVADYPELALGRVAYPQTSAALAAHRTDEVIDLQRQWLRREGLAACGLVGVVMLLLPFLVPLLFGEDYEDMIWGAEYLLAGVAVSSLFFFLVPYLYSAGRVKAWAVAYGIYAVWVVGVGAILTASHGFTALALVTGGGFAVLNVLLGLAVMRQIEWLKPQRLPE